jgi:excisionase family DNA binding protein
MEGNPGTEPFLTVAEVAELLKLNQQTVRNWIDQGSLPALRVGRRVRIRRADLDRLLESGSTISGRIAGPSAEDFWGGKPVGVAELEPGAAVAADADDLEWGAAESDDAGDEADGQSWAGESHGKRDDQ